MQILLGVFFMEDCSFDIEYEARGKILGRKITHKNAEKSEKRRKFSPKLFFQLREFLTDMKGILNGC